MNTQLHATPDERRRIGLYLRVRVHDGRVLLNALEQRAEAAGDAAALAHGVGAVELSGEGEHVRRAQHSAQGAQAGLALVAEACLKLP